MRAKKTSMIYNENCAIVLRKKKLDDAIKYWNFIQFSTLYYNTEIVRCQKLKKMKSAFLCPAKYSCEFTYWVFTIFGPIKHLWTLYTIEFLKTFLNFLFMMQQLSFVLIYGFSSVVSNYFAIHENFPFWISFISLEIDTKCWNKKKN